MTAQLCHPLDIMRFAAEALQRGERVAFVFIVATEGGNMRAPGLRMAVRADGATIGYVSNGCVEADIVQNAIAAMAEERPRPLRYGKGSTKVDVRLACGGRIDIMIAPQRDPSPIEAAARRLAARHPATLALHADGHVDAGGDGEPVFEARLIPKIRLRIAGSGLETVLLARLGREADMDIMLQSPDLETVEAVRAVGGDAHMLKGLSERGGMEDDPWTACAILFHDHEWEMKLLPQMLVGPAFYVGALGSRRAHEARLASLRDAGVSETAIARLTAPIGIVPKLRDAPLLAISVLGDVTRAFQERFGGF